MLPDVALSISGFDLASPFSRWIPFPVELVPLQRLVSRQRLAGIA